MIANKGKNMDITDIKVAVPVSIVETIGFVMPPVVVVDANLVALVVLEMAAAVPPPAIMASAQVITGLNSETVESITVVPAKAASGTEILSNKLST